VADKIIPVSRSLYLCDFHVGYQDGKVDLCGVFNAIRPAIYPFTRKQFVVFAQLAGGAGDVPFFVDMRRLDTDEPVHTTETNVLSFPDRLTVIQFALTIERCRFPAPGLYSVELFCHNTWVTETTLRAR
jgi:hypothetical protein